MSQKEGRKYVVIPALASFIIPALLMLWMFAAGFGPPESDSAPIQGFVFTLMSFPVVFFFQLCAYWALGKSQRRRTEPSWALGSLVGAVLALPLTVLVFSLGHTAGASVWQSLLGAVFVVFLPLWASFTAGATTQYLLMKNHNQANHGDR